MLWSVPPVQIKDRLETADSWARWPVEGCGQPRKDRRSGRSGAEQAGGNDRDSVLAPVCVTSGRHYDGVEQVVTDRLL